MSVEHDNAADGSEESQTFDENEAISIDEVTADDLRALVEKTLNSIEEDGTDITNLVASMVINQTVDREVAQQLNGELSEMFVELTNEHDQICIEELVFALWIELRHIVQLIEQANEADTDADGSGRPEDDKEPTADKDSQETDSTGPNGMFLSGGSTEEESVPPDRGFQ